MNVSNLHIEIMLSLFRITLNILNIIEELLFLVTFGLVKLNLQAKILSIVEKRLE